MLIALAGISGLACLVCFIMVLIQMFKNENIGLAILGIFCGLWAFIWGWMNASKHALKKIMLIWTIATILYMIFGGMAGIFSASFSTSQ